MLVFFVAYFVSFIPCWVWASTAISFLHTAEESAGEIWNEINIPAVVYFAFQIAIAVLAWFCFVHGRGVGLFVAVRLGDAAITHWALRKPGVWTSPLLVLDASMAIAVAVST